MSAWAELVNRDVSAEHLAACEAAMKEIQAEQHRRTMLKAISRVRTYADACAALQHDEAERAATRCADKLQEMLKEEL